MKDPKELNDPQLFDDQLEVWTLIIQKSTVIPSSPMVLFDPATMQGCTEDIGSSRIMFLEMFTAKYDLELVAGNFLNSIGGGAAVDELLCRFS